MTKDKAFFMPGLYAALFAMMVNLMLPALAYPEYLPGENNPLLGASIVMDPLTCASKYGAARCDCFELDDGTQGCRYASPPNGPYDNQEMCEQAWEVCQSTTTPDGDTIWYKTDSSDNTTTMSCMGQIEIFAGEKMECRKAGLMTAGNNCCYETVGDECNFENTAEMLGYDSALMMVASKVIDIATSEWQSELVQYAGTELTKYLIETGSQETLSVLVNIGSEFGSELSESIAKYAVEEGVSQGSYAAMASTAVVEALGTMVTFIGWVYMAYKLWTMYQQMQQCAVGEDILACKIGLGKCHYTQDKCKMEVFDICLQKAKQYCCFSTKLARIIQEEGRTQLHAKGLGGPSWPDCRGLTPAEFGQIDFSSLDLSEYFEDLKRQADIDLSDDFESAIDRWSSSGQTGSDEVIGDPDSSREMEWLTGEWGECTAACGPSSKDRVVSCVYTDDQTAAPESGCDLSTKPDTSQLCTDESLCNYEWVYDEWSECDDSCYGGTSYRLPKCRLVGGDVVDDSKCATAKPDIEVKSCGGAIECDTCEEAFQANPALSDGNVELSWGTAKCDNGWTGFDRMGLIQLGLSSSQPDGNGDSGVVGGFPWAGSRKFADGDWRLFSVMKTDLPFTYTQFKLDGFTVRGSADNPFDIADGESTTWTGRTYAGMGGDIAFGSTQNASPTLYWSDVRHDNCQQGLDCVLPDTAGQSVGGAKSDFSILFTERGVGMEEVTWVGGVVWFK